jgi:tetratricopeptide (TPR) repeat protein
MSFLSATLADGARVGMRKEKAATMNPADDEDLSELLEEEYISAQAMPRLEMAIRKADAHGDIDLAFRLRLKAFERPYPDVRKFVAFSWCLSHFNRDPQRFAFAADEVIEGLDWISAVAYAYPQFTLEQLWGMLDQLRDLRQSHGHSLRPVYAKLWRTALKVGDDDRLRRYHTLWKRAARDEGEMCPACETHIWLEYWGFRNKHQRAAAVGEHSIAGRSCQQCQVYMLENLSNLLRPLVAVGRLEEAEKCQRRAQKLLAWERDGNLYLQALAEHLAYLRHTANFTKALEMLEKYLAIALTTDDIDNRYRFYTASSALLRRVAEHQPNLPLRLPPSFPLRVKDGRYEAATLAEWFEKEAAPLGAAFDQRNGNDRYTKMVREQLI